MPKGECLFNWAFIHKGATLDAGLTAVFYAFMGCILCFVLFLWLIELESCSAKIATQTSLTLPAPCILES